MNLGVALPGPAQHTRTIVGRNGTLNAGPYLIGVGVTWAGQKARIDWDDTHFAVFINHRLVRAGTIDHSRRYQTLTGRRNKPRIT